MKNLLSLVFILTLSLPAMAQINVTATVTDRSGSPYFNASLSVDLVVPSNAPQQPLYNGSVFQQHFVSNLNSNGYFSVVLFDNNIISDGLSPSGTQWKFSICMNRNSPYFGLPCFNYSTTITGSSPQDISAGLVAVAPFLPTSPTKGGGPCNGLNTLCVSSLNAIPAAVTQICSVYTNGTVDATAAVGSDANFNVNIPLYGNGTACPIVLRPPESMITSNGSQVLYTSYSAILCPYGPGCVIQSTGSASITKPVIEATPDSNGQTTQVNMDGLQVFEDDQAANSGQLACDFPVMSNSYLQRIYCYGGSYGAKLGRIETGNYFGYNTAVDIHGAGGAASILVSYANSDAHLFLDAHLGVGSLHGNTGIFIDGAQGFNPGWIDAESNGVGVYNLAGGYIHFNGGYVNGNYVSTLAWAANTTYILGQVINVSGYEYEVISRTGISGSSPPTWPTTNTTPFFDNTVQLQLVPSPGGVVNGEASATSCLVGPMISNIPFQQEGLGYPCSFYYGVSQNTQYFGGIFNAYGGFNGGAFAAVPLSFSFTAQGACATSGPPVEFGEICYHQVSGATSTHNFWLNFNDSINLTTPALNTGLSAEATLTTSPNVVGVVESMTLVNGGTGHAASGTSNLTCTGTGTVTATWTASGGIVNSVGIGSGGTGVAPQTCAETPAPGGGTAFTVTVDSNYYLVGVPNVTINGFGIVPFPGGLWDVVGPSVDTTSVATGLNVVTNSVPGMPYVFMLLSIATTSYSAPTRNSSADIYVGGQPDFAGGTVAASSCGSLSGAAGCIVVQVGGVTHYVPYW